TTHGERKQLLRYLVKDVALTKQETMLRIDIRWQTEACTTVEIPRPRRAPDIRRTDPVVIARIRELATTQTDRQIAARLNDDGLVAGLKGAFTASKVQWLRYKYGIPSGCPEGPLACPAGLRGDGRYSARAAAALLNVTVSTIAAWCATGQVD